MDIGYVLFWTTFSLLLAILYYRFVIINNAFQTKVIQGLTGILGALKTQISKIILIFGGILTGKISQRISTEEVDENANFPWVGSADFQGEDIDTKNIFVRINILISKSLRWMDGLITDQAKTRPELPYISRKQLLLEWGFIFILVTAYCTSFLDLQTNNVLPGNESAVFQVADHVLETSTKQNGVFPLWNPYIENGIPFDADPMLHTYNPLMSVPVLLFGTLNGFKIGVYLGFLVAAFGMWWFSRILGLNGPARVWAALLFTFSGPPAARFVQGHYLFIPSLSWMPWGLGMLIAAFKYPRWLYITGAALAFALMFFSGNIYYPYYMLYVLAILAIFFLFAKKNGKLVLKKQTLVVLIFTGILSLGLIAIEFLPLVEFHNYLSKAPLEIGHSHTLQQIWWDLTLNTNVRPDTSLTPEEYYAYIGLWPFIALLALPFAWKPSRRRLILYFVALVLFSFIWIDFGQMPWRDFLINTPSLAQFRYPTRFLVLLVLALIMLASLSLDGLFSWVHYSLRKNASKASYKYYLANLFSFVIIGFMFLSIAEVFRINQDSTHTAEEYPDSFQVTSWLRQYDRDIYYVSAPNGWHDAMIVNQLRFSDAWYYFGEIGKRDNQINKRSLEIGPNYLIRANDAHPNPNDVTLVKQFQGFSIYKVPHSLPFAFTIPTATLLDMTNTTMIERSEVAPATPFIPDPNQIEVITEGSTDAILVVLSTNYPGWQLSIDDKASPIINVDGFMAAKLESGIHRYTFSYRPKPFFLGLGISLITLFAVLGLLIRDTRVEIIAKFNRPQPILERIKRIYEPGLTQFTNAIYENGTLKPEKALEIDEHSKVYLIIQPETLRPTKYSPALQQWIISTQTFLSWLFSRQFLPSWLLFGSILVYALCVSTKLDRFPIYFFGDEAIYMNMVADFIRNGFKNHIGEFLPTFFSLDGWVNGTSVYVQLIPYLLFGKSVVVTRLVSVFITLLGAIALSLLLKKVFKVKYYWTGIFLLLTTPAWFLHVRTVFEYAEVAAFYCIFLYFYGRYRKGDLRSLYFAVSAGALCFYTDGLGEILMGVTGLALLIVDFRYHLHPHRRKAVLFGFLLGIVLLMPFVRYYLAYPREAAEQITQPNSYWASSSLSLVEKLKNFIGQYALGLNPWYWYFPDPGIDFDRHKMLGYGNGLWFTLPFMLTGLFQAIKNIRKPAYRLVIIALLACPIPASVEAIGMPGMLWMAVPLAILTAIGLSFSLQWIEKRLRISAIWPALGLFAALTLLSLYMLNDALVNGPTWFQDYGLSGMQYGAQQVFGDTMLPALEKNPALTFVVSPSWTDSINKFNSFFIPPEMQSRVEFGQPIDFLNNISRFTSGTLFVTTSNEYDKLVHDPRFTDIYIQDKILYPDGQPGFYVIALKPVDNLDEIIRAEQKRRRDPIEDTMLFNGDQIRVVHSPLSAGRMEDVFDDDPGTFTRGLEANPFVLNLYLKTAISTHRMIMKTAVMPDFTVTISLYAPGASEPVKYIQEFKIPDVEPLITMNFDRGPQTSERIEIEVKDNLSGDTSEIHLRTIQFK